MKSPVRTILALCAAVAFAAGMAPGLEAQSLDVSGRQNGLRLLGYGLFNDEGLEGSGGGFAYAIAGRLDVGFDAGMFYSDLEGTASEESRMNFLLRGLLARQSEGFPFSLSLAFSYYLSRVQSDYLENRFTDYELLRDGRGYTISGGVWRDFHFSPAVAIRTGAGARLGWDRYTTALGSSPTESDLAGITELQRYPTEDLDRSFTYEGSLGPVIRPGAGDYVLSALGTFRYGADGAVAGGVEVGVTFARPQ
ncbi:MAG: hypothetical protein GVY14_01790 [Spirochaetes bacterium]|jgi:hypothetical protein|nr:hypothetical protein [Spirochaetota bacterium]